MFDPTAEYFRQLAAKNKEAKDCPQPPNRKCNHADPDVCCGGGYDTTLKKNVGCDCESCHPQKSLFAARKPKAKPLPKVIKDDGFVTPDGKWIDCSQCDHDTAAMALGYRGKEEPRRQAINDGYVRIVVWPEQQTAFMMFRDEQDAQRWAGDLLRRFPVTTEYVGVEIGKGKYTEYELAEAEEKFQRFASEGAAEVAPVAVSSLAQSGYDRPCEAKYCPASPCSDGNDTTKLAAQRGIFYHGSSIRNLHSILKQGLIPEVKVKNWNDDPEHTYTMPSRESYGGIYVTRNLMTATGAPQDRIKEGRVVVVVMELQPNTFRLDEDTINCSQAKNPIGNMSDIQRYVVQCYLSAQSADADPSSKEWGKELMQTYIDGCIKQWKWGMEQREQPMHPELEKRLQEQLPELWLAGLGRIAAHLCHRESDYAKWDYQSGYQDAFPQVEYDKIPDRKEVIPSVAQAEATYRDAADKITLTLRQLAHPPKNQYFSIDNGRVMEPIGFSGSNRIVTVIECRDGRAWRGDDWKKPAELIVHYGNAPEDFLRQWRERVGENFVVKRAKEASDQREDQWGEWLQSSPEHPRYMYHSTGVPREVIENEGLRTDKSETAQVAKGEPYQGYIFLSSKDEYGDADWMVDTEGLPVEPDHTTFNDSFPEATWWMCSVNIPPDRLKYLKDGKTAGGKVAKTYGPVYHGTYHEWSDNIQIDKYKIGKFFSTNPLVAQAYGSFVHECYLTMNKPFVVDAKGSGYFSIPTPKAMQKWTHLPEIDTDNIVRFAYENGYDGVIVKDVSEMHAPGEEGDDYIVWKSSQIKRKGIVEPEISPYTANRYHKQELQRRWLRDHPEYDDKKTSKTAAYTAYVLTPASRKLLLEKFPPKFPNVIAHHVTVQFGVPQNVSAPEPADVQVVGYASDESLEAVVVSVNGQTQRKDGSTYHITLSLDRSKGRKPVDSNKVVQAGWKKVAPFAVETMPEKLAHKIADYTDSEGFWAGAGNAASGILPVCPSTGRIGMAMRSGKVDHPHTYGTIGGAVKHGMSPEQSAKEELGEEVGYRGDMKLVPAYVFTSGGGFKYHNYIGVVPQEFGLHPDDGMSAGMWHEDETDSLDWMTYDEVLDLIENSPTKLHPGMLKLFRNSSDLIEQALGMKKAAQKNPALDDFMRELWAQTYQNPFNNRERVWDNKVAIECRPFNNRIHLSLIRTLDPQKGFGSQGMKFLCDLADKHEVGMELEADRPHGMEGPGQRKLMSWYSRFGFRRGRQEFGAENYMVRDPKTVLKIDTTKPLKEVPIKQAAHPESLADRIGRIRSMFHHATIDITIEPNLIHIDFLGVPEEKQGSGYGTSIMWKLCDLADEFKLPVELEAQSYSKYEKGNIGQRALEKWYEKFGFKKTGQKSAEGHPIMRREPQLLET